MTKRAMLSEEIEKLRGATATVWGYSVSHGTLTLRLQRPGHGGNTHLVCGGCSRIELSTHWFNSNLEISTEDPENIEHNVEPIF